MQSVRGRAGQIATYLLAVIVAQFLFLLLLQYRDGSSGEEAGVDHHTGQHRAGDDTMMQMQMWFQTTTHVTLWFKSWHITSPLWYAMSCFGLFILCIAQEGLGRWRITYPQTTKSRSKSVESAGAGLQEQESLITSRQARDSTSHILLTLGYGANVATSYLLMLAVMTFNVGYFITVVLGLMVGHFLLFSPALDSSSSGRLSELCCPQPS